RTMEEIRITKQKLIQHWNSKESKLYQCLQLKMFEGDAGKMLEWIKSNRELFLANFTEIGRNSQEAKELQDEHNHFTLASMNVQSNVNRLQQVASHLIEGGHYAAATIQ